MYAAFRPKYHYIGKALTSRAYIFGREIKLSEIRKYLPDGRNGFTKSRCSEPRTGFTDARGAARFKRSHAASKSRYPSLMKWASTAAFPADFGKTEYYAKQRSRFSETETRFAVFITKIWEVFIDIRNEIKSQIVRAGFTMQEVVDRLAEEYDWSDSVSNLSAKLTRKSIRYKEVVELADVLDCDILWVKRGARR